MANPWFNQCLQLAIKPIPRNPDPPSQKNGGLCNQGYATIQDRIDQPTNNRILMLVQYKYMVLVYGTIHMNISVYIYILYIK